MSENLFNKFLGKGSEPSKLSLNNNYENVNIR